MMTAAEKEVIEKFKRLSEKAGKLKKTSRNFLQKFSPSAVQMQAIEDRAEKFMLMNFANRQAMAMTAKELDNAPFKIPASILEWRLYNEAWWEE